MRVVIFLGLLIINIISIARSWSTQGTPGINLFFIALIVGGCICQLVIISSKRTEKTSNVSGTLVEYVINNQTGKATNEIFRKERYPGFSVLTVEGNYTTYVDQAGGMLTTIKFKSADSGVSKPTHFLGTGFLIYMTIITVALVVFTGAKIGSSASAAAANTARVEAAITEAPLTEKPIATTRAVQTEPRTETTKTTTTSYYEPTPEDNVALFIIAYADARTNQDINLIAPYIIYNSPFYTGQKDFIENHPAGLTLDEYDILDVDYLDDTSCIVTTRESYVVRGKTKVQLVTQECKYYVDKVGGEWLIRDYAEDVKVLHKIDQ